MDKMEITKYVVGPVMTNCYFVANKDTKEALIVDPGDEANLLIDRITLSELKPVAILLTHGHFDHVGAVSELKDEFGIPVYVGEHEMDTIKDPHINRSGFFDRVPTVYSADIPLKDDEVIELAGFKIKVLFTPGHTPGGVCYYFPDENVLFSGDTLFYNSVGRTDFLLSSGEALIKGIKEKLMTLDDSVIVLTGHDASTTIGEERMHNPYL